ncbi:MAG: hypothetical protein K2H64_01290, partial [Desulfovibrio sp.]|nr:hypothetical protein [Desulfovibrio sp.]
LILVGAAISLITPGLLTDMIGLGLMLVVYGLQKIFKHGPKGPRADPDLLEPSEVLAAKSQ